MLKKPQYIALFLVALVVVALWRLPNNVSGNLKRAIAGMFLPLFGIAGASHDLAEKAGQSVVPKSVLQTENDRLRRDNQELRIQLIQAESVWRENERLRRMSGSLLQRRWSLKFARIIARDPANWWRSALIDAGTVDGLRANQPVVSPEGWLVGRVNAVSERRAQIALLGDPELRVAAVAESSRENGILQALYSTPLENNMMDLDFLPGNSRTRPGEGVYTAGDGGVFPPGLPIGKVVDARSKDYGLSTEARVKLAAPMGSLEEVWVVIQ
jgi:rod shape-determining protein MreC